MTGLRQLGSWRYIFTFVKRLPLDFWKASVITISGFSDPVVRRVFFRKGHKFVDYAEWQSSYMDTKTRKLLPNTEVYVGRRLRMRTNSLRCKGPELKTGVPVIGAFGDSVVMGANLTGFVGHIRVPGYQALNGGLEGSNLKETATRFETLSRQIEFACIVLHVGWHNLIYGQMSEEHWGEQMDRFSGVPVIAHLRLTADICDEAVEKGYAPFLNDGYRPVHPLIERKKGRERIAEAIGRFNDFQDRYCAERGRIVIDLDPLLKPKNYDEISLRFFDMGHPRPTEYPMMGEEISRQLAPRLGRRVISRSVAAPAGQPATAYASSTESNPYVWPLG